MLTPSWCAQLLAVCVNEASSSVMAGRSFSNICMADIKCQHCSHAAEVQLIGCFSWAQGNKAVQDAGGFFDLLLTEAANMANTAPAMFDPLTAMGTRVASICLLIKCPFCSAAL